MAPVPGYFPELKNTWTVAKLIDEIDVDAATKELIIELRKRHAEISKKSLAMCNDMLVDENTVLVLPHVREELKVMWSEMRQIQHAIEMLATKGKENV